MPAYTQTPLPVLRHASRAQAQAAIVAAAAAAPGAPAWSVRLSAEAALKTAGFTNFHSACFALLPFFAPAQPVQRQPRQPGLFS